MTTARTNPKAPHNQAFQLNKSSSNKKSWWNPSSPTYFDKKKK